jgi:hypothetical protein
MPLSDSEEAVFADLANRLGPLNTPIKWKSGRVAKLAVVLMIVGLAGLVWSFTWSTILGLVFVGIMGVGAWGFFVLVPRLVRGNKFGDRVRDMHQV